MFDNLNQDQDPLDFHMKLETLEPPAPAKVVTAEDRELIELGEEADRLQKEFLREWDDHASPAKQLALYREKLPANLLAHRFLKLAAAHPDHPIVLRRWGTSSRPRRGAAIRRHRFRKPASEPWTR